MPDPHPTPIEPHEQLIWDLIAHTDRYRDAKKARNVKAMQRAFDAARRAHEALGDELDRMAEEDDIAAEGRKVA